MNTYKKPFEKRRKIIRKVLIALFFALCLFGSAASAESDPVETVSQMTISVQFPDVLREGLYTGQIVNGIPEGHGVFEAINGTGTSYHCIGQWSGGKMNGRGARYYDNGFMEIGEYLDNNLFAGFRLWPGGKFEDHFDKRRDTESAQYIKRLKIDTKQLVFEGYYSKDGERPLRGTLYDSKGRIIISGEFGEAYTNEMFMNLINMAWQ